MQDLTQKSKYLSLLLRHKPEKVSLNLDKNGWCTLDELVKKSGLSLKDVEKIVETDNKKRYTIEGNRIRANQGHSVEVDLQLKAKVPPEFLYHGAKRPVIDLIRKDGLKKMNRHHVHLSHDLDTARSVANRRKGEDVILRIAARRAHTDGIKFYQSENGVWLVDSVPSKYIDNFYSHAL